MNFLVMSFENTLQKKKTNEEQDMKRMIDAIEENNLLISSPRKLLKEVEENGLLEDQDL